MKKINYLLVLFCVACLLEGCAWGTYIPHATVHLGTETKVVLDKANFRVVRNVEAVIEVNNTNLRRADVEKSAFAELMRKYPLVGSQTYINVVIEEVRRENSNFFRFWFGGQPKKKQYVAVRATIIEFLQENGQPVQGIESPYDTAPQRTIQSEAKNEEKNTQNVVDVQEMSNSKIEIPEQKKQSDMQELKDMAYIAYLWKAGTFKQETKKEISAKFNIEEIKSLYNNYSLEELKEMSNGHNKELGKYKLYKK